MTDPRVDVQEIARVHEPPARILLCLEGCFEEFYLPLDLNERVLCPVDSTHTVAVYSGPTIHKGWPDA